LALVTLRLLRSRPERGLASARTRSRTQNVLVRDDRSARVALAGL